MAVNQEEGAKVPLKAFKILIMMKKACHSKPGNPTGVEVEEEVEIVDSSYLKTLQKEAEEV